MSFNSSSGVILIVLHSRGEEMIFDSCRHVYRSYLSRHVEITVDRSRFVENYNYYNYYYIIIIIKNYVYYYVKR